MRAALKLTGRRVKQRGASSRSRLSARPSVGLSEAADLWLANVRGGVSSRGKPYSAASVLNYTYHVRGFVGWCGERSLASLDADDLRDHLGELRRAGIAAKTVQGRETTIRLWLDWLAGRSLISEVSFKKVKRVAAPDLPVVALSRGEIDRLIAVCDANTQGGVRDIAILLTLLGTGLRAAELCGLDVADYDRDEGTLLVRHGKGDKARTVGVPNDTAAALDEWIILARGWEPGAMFDTERGDRLTTGTLRSICARLGKRAGVAGVHPHRCRHTAAITALRAGLDLYTLSRQLGHTSIVTTQGYLRAMTDAEAAADHRRAMNGVGRKRR